MNISEIASQLQTALKEAQAAHEALEKAKVALTPLEQAATDKDETVAKLMIEYQTQTGVGSAPAPATTRRRRRAPLKARTPEENVLIQEKKARTQAERAGLSKKDADKAAREAGAKSAAKAGIPYPLKA
jgi:hypothetical protein